jgi:hypothetical protein
MNQLNKVLNRSNPSFRQAQGYTSAQPPTINNQPPTINYTGTSTLNTVLLFRISVCNVAGCSIAAGRVARWCILP